MKTINGFTVLEVLIIIAILVILAGAIMPVLTNFSRGRDVETSALKLLEDLRQTQQFSRVTRDEFQYYGMNFLSGLGVNADRNGYRIVRFQPLDPVLPITNFTCPAANCTVIISSNAAENPEFLQDTFFSRFVNFDNSSELRTGNSIVFTPQGSATTNGQNLLNATNDQIRLTSRGYSRTITISPLTGYVRIE